MTRDDIYRDLYEHAAAWLYLNLESVDAALELGGDEDNPTFYYDTFCGLSDVFLYLITLRRFFDHLFTELALTPRSDPGAQAKAEEEILWRLEKMRQRTYDLEQGTFP